MSDYAPLVIGHRGAPGYRPEHTLASYRLAIELGADYIEPDLVSTKDHVLVARHEPEIGSTTDVADHPEFASRRTTKVLDGVPTTGWFTTDFTLAELRTLRAKERIPQVRQHNTLYDGRYPIPTFQEVIDLAQRLSKELHLRIGIYPETKHPTFHKSQGLPLEGAIVRTLKRNGLNKRSSPVFLQSFEQGSLKTLNKMTNVRLIQLMDANDTDASGNPTYAPPYDRPYDWTASGRTGPNDTFGWFATNPGLDEVKTYADGIGPWKVYIVPTAGGGGGAIFSPTDLIQRAHAHGLLVHTWTFRDDSFPTGYPGGPVDEYLNFYRLGIDGVFSDFPDTAFAAREIFRGL
jgi:glycerophosphoryl diester phosphodiesterase